MSSNRAVFYAYLVHRFLPLALYRLLPTTGDTECINNKEWFCYPTNCNLQVSFIASALPQKG